MQFEHYLAAQDAIRDILFMYRFLLDYRGLYDDFGSEDGAFDPLAYVDVPDDPDLSADDLRLLREGSAIKVLCYVLQSYGQGGYPDRKDEFMERVERAVAEGRFGLVPELEAALHTGLRSPAALNERSATIYDKYVVGYLSDLVRASNGTL